MEKTNAMRILEQCNQDYTPHYVDGQPTDGITVARLLAKDVDYVFKTLVTESGTEHFVFVIPVAETLDLKKAAKAVGVKSVSMLHQKDLFPLTGYVHGGCSPIGMKKRFVTVVDETALLCDKMFFSAGKIGVQIEAAPSVLVEAVGAKFADITQSKQV